MGDTKVNVYSERLKGFKYVLTDHDIPFNPKDIIHSNLNEDAGGKIANKILSRKNLPDGLFIYDA
ncbi:hypothetical protein QWY93_13940 [Echinicola jeungdonensis]|uniref:Uncharacterized protein n=1 Tax=Echinicola jeungdonensis TaxID=709343 RepID=A0ABV5J9I3_9BACT|nr:hypothetical protein [Echinicola jeungdonensis]MDN3670418.1 hypothetical protein [Echinicola jeungdonensis]